MQKTSHLKSGCGFITGISPSTTPRSLMLNSPSGSNKPFNRSKTDGLKKPYIQ